MSSDTGTTDRVEIGAGDIQITERGGVEIINFSLAEALKSALAAEKRGEATAARTGTNNCPQYVCGQNIPCKGGATA